MDDMEWEDDCVYEDELEEEVEIEDVDFLCGRGFLGR